MDGIESVLSRTKYNTNTSHSVSKSTNTKTLKQVQVIATKIEDTLGRQEQSRYAYYCKVAWQLPEHTIWYCLESATRGRDPQRLFSYLTKQYIN